MRIRRERRREPRRRGQYSAVVTSAAGRQIFAGRVKNVSRHGVRLKGLSPIDDFVKGTPVKVRVTIENIDPLKAAKVVTLSGRVCRVKPDYNAIDVGILFNSPFELETSGRFVRFLKKFAKTCFTKCPRY